MRSGQFALCVPHFAFCSGIIEAWSAVLPLEEIQTDGRIRRWAKIPEADDKYLRVILLEDGETVHNAFFDRSFSEDM